MAKPEQTDANTNLTPAQEALRQLWEEHVQYEFSTRNTEDTLATMVDDAYVNHIPVLTGGVGRDGLREFYSRRFIPQMPPDTEMTPVSRTIGEDQLVDEMVFKFTHTIRMDWMLPGVAPTEKRVEVPLVAIVRFRDGKLAHEHIYWDQASVLVQIGLLDAAKLPVAGVESARKVLDPSLPANALIRRADLNQLLFSRFETVKHIQERRMSAQPMQPSLYERLGGIYSIATVVDDFIDRVMTDPRLNANPAVNEAHHKVPPAGFKYLVTEMVGWASGGPQKYTGRPMRESHEHLNITPKEWEAFMDDFQQTLDKFSVPAAEQAELKAIVNSTYGDIVIGKS
jgi:carboxymethylenebutenolidase